MGLELGGAQPLLHNLSSFQPFNQTENWITATTFYSPTKHKKWLSLTKWLGISSSPEGYPLNQTAPYSLLILPLAFAFQLQPLAFNFLEKIHSLFSELVQLCTNL
jgi:hypothetical protein